MGNIAIIGLLGAGDSVPKSVIFDFADNWGSTSVMGIRSIDFWNDGSKITITASDITCYATSTYSGSYLPSYSFITSLSKTGTSSNTMWYSGSGNVTNQRLICVFDEPTNFDSIVVNNGHDTGASLTAGVQNTKIYTSPNTITSTVYNSSISGGIKIFDSSISRHSAVDVEDPETLTLI